MILCVGETLEQRKANQTEALLDRQLGLGLANVQNDTLRRVSIAYEPVWAIGNAQHHATPQQAQEAHAVLRARFGKFSERQRRMQFPSSTEGASYPMTRPRCSVDRALTAP